MPAQAAGNPHSHIMGNIQGNMFQQQPISTIYASANDVLLGEDRQQIISGPVQSHQQDPWLIIQKMSEDNRVLIEQVARLTTQLAHLQSILYQQQQQNTTHGAAVTAMQVSQNSPVITSTLPATPNTNAKRTLSSVDQEIKDAIEMDMDPNTRVVLSSHQKKKTNHRSNVEWRNEF